MRLWVVVVMGALCQHACATGPDGRPVRHHLLVCQKDSDCMIVSHDVLHCCNPCPVEPYAINRSAIGRCTEPECLHQGCSSPAIPSPGFFKAVCAEGQCQRRRRTPSDSNGG